MKSNTNAMAQELKEPEDLSLDDCQLLIAGLNDIAAHAADNDDDYKLRAVIDLRDRIYGSQVIRLLPPGGTGCENCRATERNLALAIGIIEAMLAAGRCLSNAQRAVEEHTASLKEQRIAAARWLEELR